MSLKNFSARECFNVAAAAAILVFAACTPKQVKTVAQPIAAPPVEVSTVPPANVEEASLRTGAFAAAAEVKIVYFEYNKAELTADARAILQANAGYLNDHTDLDVRVAGSCDERGTVEYNLALGQHRAKAVRDYYIRLGVNGERIATISYGKEDPVCSEHTEACWAQNRRAESWVRSNQSADTSAAATTEVPPLPTTPASAATPAPSGAGQ